MDRIDEKDKVPVTREKESPRRSLWLINIPTILRPNSPFDKVSESTFEPRIDIVKKKEETQVENVNIIKPKSDSKPIGSNEIFKDDFNKANESTIPMGNIVPEEEPLIESVPVMPFSVPKKEGELSPWGKVKRWILGTLAISSLAGQTACTAKDALAEFSTEPPTTDTVPGSDTQESPTQEPTTRPMETNTPRFEKGSFPVDLAFKDNGLGDPTGVEMYIDEKIEGSDKTLLEVVTEESEEILGIKREDLNIYAFNKVYENGKEPEILVNDTTKGTWYFVHGFDDETSFYTSPDPEGGNLFLEIFKVPGENKWGYLVGNDSSSPEILDPPSIEITRGGTLMYRDPRTGTKLVLKSVAGGQTAGSGKLEEILKNPNSKYIDPEFRRLQEEGFAMDEMYGVQIAVDKETGDIAWWNYNGWEKFFMYTYEGIDLLDTSRMISVKMDVESGKLSAYLRLLAEPFWPEGKGIKEIKKKNYYTWVAINSKDEEVAMIDMKKEESGWISKETGERIPYRAVNDGNFIMPQFSEDGVSVLRVGDKISDYISDPNKAFTKVVSYSFGKYIVNGTIQKVTIISAKIIDPPDEYGNSKIGLANYCVLGSTKEFIKSHIKMQKGGIFLPVAGYDDSKLKEKRSSDYGADIKLDIYDFELKEMIRKWQRTGRFPDGLENRIMELDWN